MLQLRFVGRRALLAIPSLFAISLLSFLMLRLSPGDPARVIAGPRATVQTLLAIRTQMGLDQPIWIQYVRYLGRVVHGDFGENLTGSQTVSQVIGQSVGVTAYLVLGAALLTAAISIPLAVSMAPILIRSLRSSLIEVQNADYVKAGRAMGVTGFALTRRFVARNATVPTVPVIATVIGFLIGGTVIIESTFDLPGLGSALVQAAQTRDTNVVQGITLVLGAAVIVIYLIADVGLTLIDPRVKVS